MKKNPNLLIQKIPSYRIAPKIIPRPSEFEDIYLNENQENIYYTSIDSHTPHSSSQYIVKETENSSCRFIRSSLIKIPTSQYILNNSNLLLGIYCQPFAEIQENENEIPKINLKNGILRCKRCNAYINSQFIITMSKIRKQVIICNLCQYENILDNSLVGFKSEYLIGNPFEYCNELKYPTLDFLAPEIMIKDVKDFIPHYLFCIDISTYSYQIGLPIYILNSIQSYLNSFHNSENSYIGFLTFDMKGIQYYSLGKNKVINITHMNDSKNPFCPISPDQLYYNVRNDEEDILTLIEKIISYIDVRRQKEQTPNGNIAGTAIYSGIESLSESGGRILIFNATPSSSGFGGSILRNEKEFINTDKEYELFLPQHQLFTTIIDKCQKYRVAIDQFIFGNIYYDLSTFCNISNLTGGAIKFYDFQYRDIKDNPILINQNFEKLSNDIFRIISRPNYYDIKVNLRYTIGFEVLEILGAFYKKLTDNFSIPSLDPDSSFFYHLRLSDSFNTEQKVGFQLVVFYTDNFNKRYLRVFNYTNKTCNDISQIYSYCDIDVLTKLILMKELTFIYNSSQKDIRENILNKLTNMFYYYKKETKQTNSGQLVLPAQVKYLPVFINSFFKKGIYTANKGNFTSVYIIYLIHFYMKSPIYSIMLYLYPKMYKINLDKLNNLYIKKRLSLETIKLDRAYLISNGMFLDLYVFENEKSEFYQLFFGKEDYNSCIMDQVYSIEEGNLTGEIGDYLNNFIESKKCENFGNYSPLRIYFLDKNSCLKNEQLKSIVTEDSYYGEISYPDFLYSLHEKIQKKFK